MRSVLRDRNLRLLLGADALSLTGSSALWLALGIWVKSLTGSTAAAGMVIFAILGPSVLLAPAGGMLVDRVRRRPLLVTVNLLTGAVVLLLLLVRTADQIWLVYAVGFGYGTSYALLRSAQSALLRTVATDDDTLVAANGALQTVAALSRLLSPIAGAGLYAALGPHSVVLLDAATFLVGAAGLALLRVTEPAPQPAEGHWRAEVGAGLAHLRRTVVLRRIVTAVSLAMLVVGFIEVVMFAIVDQGLHRSPAFLGVLDLGFGAGSVAGGVLAATAVRRLGATTSVVAGLTAVAAGMALTVLPVTVTAVLGLAVVGLGVPPLVAGMSITLQRLTPSHLLGRTSAAIDVLVSGPQSLSIALGAVLISVVDFRVLVAVMTTGILAAALWLATRPAPDPAEPVVRAAGPADRGAGPAGAAGISLPAPLPASPRVPEPAPALAARPAPGSAR
ncbi:MAG TPA: MFS transporter [Mycobacteriales bacterium]|nr:MFS transporter [Mycobacteriales bacterium]